MINKEAKLFGKINIIDFILLIGLVGLIALGAVHLRRGGGFIGGESREFIISFMTESIDDFTAYSWRVGDNAFDHILGNFLGVVYDVRLEDAIVWNADQYGNTIRATKEGFYSVHICIRITGTPSENGVLVGGNRYGVGMNRAIRAGGAMPARVSGLREVTAAGN